METLITFIYGILTCGIVGAVAYGIYQIREVVEDSDNLEDELSDLQAKYNVLERDFENKIDVVSNKIIDVDAKLDKMYQQASDEMGERLEELEDDLNKLQIKE
tara:strand:- start:54 stop:362 length:309 start_codon:yes stop_codon:yes gene_type:complete